MDFSYGEVWELNNGSFALIQKVTKEVVEVRVVGGVIRFRDKAVFEHDIKRLAIIGVLRGNVRAFVKCRECGTVYAHSYLPYSLSSPLLVIPCSCSFGLSFSQRVTKVSDAEALAYFEEVNKERLING